jgi:hypothetical protein
MAAFGVQSRLFLFVIGIVCSVSFGFAQDANPEKRTNVTVFKEDGRNITQIEIDLQKAPNSMEPAAEPRRIRIDDRANVRFLIKNLSPLDVCSRNPSSPSPTAETPVVESLVGSIGKIAPLALNDNLIGMFSSIAKGNAVAEHTKMALDDAENIRRTHQTPECRVERDPEYKLVLDQSKSFFEQAKNLIGPPPAPDCTNGSQNQVQLGCTIDSAVKDLADFLGADYRGENYTNFVLTDAKLQRVRTAFGATLTTIENAGKLQALADELGTWQTDLHKKYDYVAVAADTSAPALPPAPAGTKDRLSLSPPALAFSPVGLSQIVQLSGGGKTTKFTAEPDADWILLSKRGPASPQPGTFSDTIPKDALYDMIVTVDPSGLDSSTHYGTITISKEGGQGAIILNVTFRPPAEPTSCDVTALKKVDETADQAKAEMSIIADNNKALESAQGALKTNYATLLRADADYRRRLDQHVILHPDGVLIQKIDVGTDRKATSPGSISCVSDIDGKTPTTTNINYSLLYQDVPRWTASVGFLVTSQEKKIIDIATQTGSDPSSPTQVFQTTDRAPVQVLPMVYVNYRFLRYASTHYGKGKEDELIWTAHVSGGFGVNPNTGTNQPEAFLGLALGLNRFLIHPGVHFGRTESLGGGFALNSTVPSGITKAPITFSYHPAFSVGFSVRVAPY